MERINTPGAKMRTYVMCITLLQGDAL